MDPDGISLLTESVESTNLIWGMPSWLCWIIIIALLLFNGIFSAGENAFSICNKYHFRVEADKGNKTAKVITYLVEHYDNTLITILISCNAVSTLTSVLSALLFYEICTRNNLSGGIEAILSTVVMGLLVYIISDTIPKVVSKAIPNQVAKIVCYPIFILRFLLFPVIFLMQQILKLIHHIFHLKDENLLSKEDLLYQVDNAVNSEDMIIEEEESEPEKLFENDEKEILGNVLSFDQRKVSSVYTPLDKVYSLDINGLTADKINETVENFEYSRIPIYEDNKENIIGILVLRLYFQEYVADPHLSIQSILEDVVYISVNEELDDAFEILNFEKVHLGIVKDDNNKVLGIITMEDILEELVDDIDEETEMEGNV